MGNTQNVIPQMFLKELFLFSKLTPFEVLDKADSFLPNFLQKINT